MAGVRLMLCLMMEIILLYQLPQVVKKCVIQLVVVFHQFELLGIQDFGSMRRTF